MISVWSRRSAQMCTRIKKDKFLFMAMSEWIDGSSKWMMLMVNRRKSNACLVPGRTWKKLIYGRLDSYLKYWIAKTHWTKKKIISEIPLLLAPFVTELAGVKPLERHESKNNFYGSALLKPIWTSVAGVKSILSPFLLHHRLSLSGIQLWIALTEGLWSKNTATSLAHSRYEKVMACRTWVKGC